MKEKYSLYEIIKPKLSPVVQKKLEDKMKYNRLIQEKKHEEENL
jgi:hypothetical protein